MNQDKSFESLARLVCDEAGVTVEFGKFNPHSDLSRRVIRLPAVANQLNLEKRIELLCYLLHEIGHMTDTKIQGISGEGNSEDTFVYLNALEDICIQQKVESFFTGSRDIYEYVIGGIMRKRKSECDKVYPRQRILDHLIFQYTGMRKFDYDSVVAKRIDNKAKSLDILLAKYKFRRKKSSSSPRYDNELGRIADIVRRVFEPTLNRGEGHGHGSDGRLKEKTDRERLQNQASDKSQQAGQTRRKREETRQERRCEEHREKENSLSDSRKLEQEKQTIPNDTKDNKAKRKEINKKLKELREHRRDLKEKGIEDKEMYDKNEGEYGEMSKKARELDQESKDLAQQADGCTPTSCIGIKQLPTDFFQEDRVSFKESTHNSLRRLFEYVKSIVLPSEEGSIDPRRISSFKTKPESIFRITENKPRTDVHLGFMLDGSSSMLSNANGGYGYYNYRNQRASGFKGSLLNLCYNSFRSIADSVVKLSKQEFGQVTYGVTYFTHFHKVLKPFKEKHRFNTLDRIRDDYYKLDHGGTEASEGLKEMFKQMRRLEGRKVIFLITDGQFSQNFINESWYKNGIRKGIRLCIIGIGGSFHAQKMLGRKVKRVRKMTDLESVLSYEVSKNLRR